MPIVTNIQILPFNVLTEISKYCRRTIVASYVFWILILLPVCRATSAVFLVDKNQIIIATDSLWRFSISGTARQCKINTAHSQCAHVIVGLRTKPETNFDSAVLANQACDTGANQRERAIYFGRTAKQALTAALKYSRLHQTDVYERDYRGKAVLEVFFAGFDDGKPSVAAYSFSLNTNDDLMERLINIPDDQGNNIAFSGEQAAALQFFNDPNRPDSDYETLARIAIEKEIADIPSKVGGPVDVLSIQISGYRWIEPYGTCKTDDK